jgi:hypothetical protein
MGGDSIFSYAKDIRRSLLFSQPITYYPSPGRGAPGRVRPERAATVDPAAPAALTRPKDISAITWNGPRLRYASAEMKGLRFAQALGAEVRLAAKNMIYCCIALEGIL